MAEGRDIIVIGGSAGALQAVIAILSQLDPKISAAVLVVLHSAENAQRYLARILERQTPLRVRYGEDHEPIELGTITIAPPDRHLIVKPGEVRVVRGPKENNFRPAIDALFRSAANTYVGRVIGVILSGLLDDGAHGLFQVKQQGGVTIAQSPDEAPEPSMPRAAIELVGVQYVLTAKEIGPLLNSLTQGAEDIESRPRQEQRDIAEGRAAGLRIAGVDSPTSPFSCPQCGGALWELRDGNLLRYRCHVGHGFSAQTLTALVSDEVEQALWTSVRLLEEQAELQRRLADKSQSEGNLSLGERFQSNVADRRYAADLIRRLLTGDGVDDATLKQPNIRGEYDQKSG
jgi:two-component system chemotaxis response regulator CheB